MRCGALRRQTLALKNLLQQRCGDVVVLDNQNPSPVQRLWTLGDEPLHLCIERVDRPADALQNGSREILASETFPFRRDSPQLIAVIAPGGSVDPVKCRVQRVAMQVIGKGREIFAELAKELRLGRK